MLQKEQLKKTVETTGDLISNKIADKIKSVSKKSPKMINSKQLPSNEATNEIPKERYIYPKERRQIIDESRLI